MKRPIDLLCGRLEEAARSGETLNMKYFYAATTLDIINDYCFARQPENVLKSDFARKTHDDVDGLLKMSLLVGFPPVPLESADRTEPTYSGPYPLQLLSPCMMALPFLMQSSS